MQNMLDFSGKRVLVTGGSNGIGNGIACAFRDAGADVLATGTKAQDTYDTDMADMEYAEVDLGSDDAVQALAHQAGQVDVLVNNAGMIAYKRREFDDRDLSQSHGCQPDSSHDPFNTAAARAGRC